MTKEEFFKIKPYTPGYSPTISTYLYVQAAIEMGCEVEYIDGSDFIVIKRNGIEKTLRLDYCKASFDFHAYSILIDKYQTKLFLKRGGVNISPGEILGDADQNYIQKIKHLKRPLVVKPIKGTDAGFGVSVGLMNDDEIIEKVTKLVDSGYNPVLAEEQFIGNEYRLLATRETFLAATKRVPANVIGDGENSIKTLIEIKNSDPNRGGHDYQKPLLKIEIDDDLIKNLSEQDLMIDNILEKDRRVFLRKTSNLSTGGDSVDITDDVHPDIAKIAVQSICAVPELPYAGIDIMTEDISKSPDECNYIILEMNTSPGIFMHHFPYEGKSRNVAKDILEYVFRTRN